MLTRELLRAIRQIVGAVDLAGMDIVEVSPPYDHAETTAMVANRAALEAHQRARRQAASPATRSASSWPEHRHRATARSTGRRHRRGARPPVRPRPVDDPGDLDLYLALAARADGPILELAVGTGRLAIPLAEAGHRVTGVDLDPAMLDRARDRATRRQGGARTADPRRGRYRRRRLPDAGLRARLHRAQLAPRAAHPGRPASRPRERWPTTSRRVVSPWSTSGCPTPTTWPGSTGGSCLEWPRLDPETGMIVTKIGSAQHDASSASVTTTIFEEGGQGEPPSLGAPRPPAARHGGPAPRVRRGRRAVVEMMAGDYEMAILGRAASARSSSPSSPDRLPG